MSWSAQRMVPYRSHSQCSDVSCGQNYGHCGRPLSCLSQERRSSLTVQRCSEAWNVDRKWCTAAPSWECFRDIGCVEMLSKSEQVKLDEAGRLTTAGNAWADELAKEEARDDSFQSILCDTYKAAVETNKAIISYIGSFILRAKGRE